MINALKLPGKILAQGRLLATHPSKFFQNLNRTLNPDAYRRKVFEQLELAPIIEPIFRVDPTLADRPTLNVMLPYLTRSQVTGGPNTAIIIACHIAASGIPVRLVSVDDRLDADQSWFWEHLGSLIGANAQAITISLATCCDQAAPLAIGVNDMFLATYWATARSIAYCLEHMNIKEFIYLIQDYEPGFFEWSSNYAMALDTYDMNFRAIINEATLADYLCRGAIGRFADSSFIDRCTVFEPAVDARYFHSVNREANGPKRLLFYARPGRNMMSMGYGALRSASAHLAFAGRWEFLAIGATRLPDLDLANGKQLRPVPWMAYSDYAKLVRDSDILLCLMLSPHTSYPTLEMVASGGITVTNSFATKTRERLAQISPNFIVARPNIQAIAACLIEAAKRVTDGYDRSACFTMPRDWSASLEKTTETVHRFFYDSVGRVPDQTGG
jgi:O-antigen biosynthesis protein